MILLQATQITKRFAHRMVLNGVDLDVQAGEVVAIFGPNGAGKTTLIKILSTLVKPTSGAFQIAGIDAIANPLRVRSSLGVVAHEPFAYLEWSPYENLKFFGRLYGVDALEERIADLLADVELTPFAHEPVRIFSRGMTQRFMIAKALIHDPTLLLFDEPFSGLDVAAKQFVLKLIQQERARGKGLILTTHDTELGYHAASRFLFLLDGQIEPVAEKAEIELTELSRQYEQRLKK
ncbi:MAG: ABC transporter ATP-binding protein [Candidatus Poribacteria bacterium]|nr:ABC transporter ATP-binding protein [Candidatus Poribacteria bacterium]